MLCWYSVSKNEALNHTLASSHLYHFDKLWRHMKPPKHMYRWQDEVVYELCYIHPEEAC